MVLASDDVQTTATPKELHTFGSLLRQHRLVASLTQEQLAERAGLSARAISDLERGVRRFPYGDSVARLGDALGLSPTQRAVFAAAGSRRPRTGPVETDTSVRRHSWPTPLTSFVGRERELGRVRGLVETARLVTIIGLGGIGKTRLALRVAADLLDAFSGGVFFVDLSPLRDPALVLSSIAGVLGVRVHGARPLPALESALSDSAVLLVLDNFERVLGAGPDIAALLRACPALHVLITSRVVLNISGEHEVLLHPLRVPEAHTIQDAVSVGRSEAVRLILDRIRAVEPDFVLTDDNASTLAQICRRLDGLPLALELAAARARFQTPEALLARLQRRLPLLVGGARDLPVRQQTLRSTLAWSYDLLSPLEQTLFRRLAVFAGGFTLDSAAAVCDADGSLSGQTAELVESLLASSLLRRTGADVETRFDMLETVREYAQEQLSASGDEQRTLRTHAAYFSGLVRNVEAQYHARDLPTIWRARFEEEHDNFRAVLRWSMDVHDTETAMELGAGLWSFWATRGHNTEGSTWLDMILALPGARTPSVKRARMLIGAGNLAVVHDFTAAEALYTEGLAVARAVNDSVSIMRGLNNLAVIALFRGDLVTARKLAEDGLELAIAEGEPGRTALLLSNLGSCAYSERDFARAQSLAEASLGAARKVRTPDHYARTRHLLGRIAMARGDYTAARVLVERSLADWRVSGNPTFIASTLVTLARIGLAQREHDRAEELLREAMRILRTIGDRVEIVRCLEGFGGLAAQRGCAERALVLVGAAAQLRQVVGIPIWPADKDLLDAVLEPARKKLGQQAEAHLRLGESMLLEDAIGLALAQDSQPLAG